MKKFKFADGSAIDRATLLTRTGRAGSWNRSDYHNAVVTHVRAFGERRTRATIDSVCGGDGGSVDLNRIAPSQYGLAIAALAEEMALGYAHNISPGPIYQEIAARPKRGPHVPR